MALIGGGEVPVRLQREKPVDSRAVTCQCRVHEDWERIGYIHVVCEALDAIHAAVDCGDILKVCFDWVKSIVQFQDCGFYVRRVAKIHHAVSCKIICVMHIRPTLAPSSGHRKLYNNRSMCACYFQALFFSFLLCRH